MAGRTMSEPCPQANCEGTHLVTGCGKVARNLLIDLVHILLLVGLGGVGHDFPVLLLLDSLEVEAAEIQQNGASRGTDMKHSLSLQGCLNSTAHFENAVYLITKVGIPSSVCGRQKDASYNTRFSNNLDICTLGLSFECKHRMSTRAQIGV